MKMSLIDTRLIYNDFHVRICMHPYIYTHKYYISKYRQSTDLNSIALFLVYLQVAVSFDYKKNGF